jgi:subtilisin family serine protease
VVADSGSCEVHNLWLINALAIQLPPDSADQAQALAKLRSNPFVERVDDDPSAASSPVPEQYDWGQQLGLVGAGVTVAVLDTGIDPSQSKLQLNLAGGYNARAGANPSQYQDDNGRGTHMAEIIAAALPGATFLAVKVLDQCGKGISSDLINGLQWVYGYNNGSPLVKLVNMSLGSSTDSLPLQKAIQYSDYYGWIIVASDGNLCEGGGDEGGGDGCEALDPAPACDAS